MTRSLERARAEVRKCILLRANCHAEVEAGLETPRVDSNHQELTNSQSCCRYITGERQIEQSRSGFVRGPRKAVCAAR